jgi:hypothetical protein
MTEKKGKKKSVNTYEKKGRKWKKESERWKIRGIWNLDCFLVYN